MNSLNILYEDDYVIVCHKKARVAVQTKNIRQLDLERMILNEFAKRNQKKEIFVVHRLDQPVEGVVVFAKTREAAADLSRQFQNSQAVKDYLAVVEGQFDNEKIHLENYMLKDNKTNVSSVVDKETKNAKLAVLDLKPLACKNNTQLVSINLKTGRHHQIRVQLKTAGHPIVGDIKYNPNYVNHRGFIQTALCAYSISFIHPINKSLLNFKVKPSSDAFLEYESEIEKYF